MASVKTLASNRGLPAERSSTKDSNQRQTGTIMKLEPLGIAPAIRDPGKGSALGSDDLTANNTNAASGRHRALEPLPDAPTFALPAPNQPADPFNVDTSSRPRGLEPIRRTQPVRAAQSPSTSQTAEILQPSRPSQNRLRALSPSVVAQSQAHSQAQAQAQLQQESHQLGKPSRLLSPIDYIPPLKQEPHTQPPAGRSNLLSPLTQQKNRPKSNQRPNLRSRANS